MRVFRAYCKSRPAAAKQYPLAKAWKRVEGVWVGWESLQEFEEANGAMSDMARAQRMGIEPPTVNRPWSTERFGSGSRGGKSRTHRKISEKSADFFNKYYA